MPYFVNRLLWRNSLNFITRHTLLINSLPSCQFPYESIISHSLTFTIFQPYIYLYILINGVHNYHILFIDAIDAWTWAHLFRSTHEYMNKMLRMCAPRPTNATLCKVVQVALSTCMNHQNMKVITLICTKFFERKIIYIICVVKRLNNFYFVLRQGNIYGFEFVFIHSLTRLQRHETNLSFSMHLNAHSTIHIFASVVYIFVYGRLGAE